MSRKKQVKLAPKFVAAEFFAGIGLVRLALEQNGWQVRFANDIDPAKAQMYNANFADSSDLVVGDIHEVNAEAVPACDLFTASFPCNDLSIAGKWEGLNGKESSAFWGLIRILQDLGPCAPELVLIENVVGFLMSRNGEDLEMALRALIDLGYFVDAIILNARHWVPQSRARLFVVAKRSACPDRQSMAFVTDVRPKALVDFINAHPELEWDLARLPTLPPADSRLIDIVEQLDDSDSLWWSRERVEYFMNQLSPRHVAQAREMIAGNKWSYATAFRRVRKGRSMAELRIDGVAGCLRTPRGGSGRQILFRGGFGQHHVRLLSARECARLQGVPEEYAITVPLNQALFGFGDAVCVPAVGWIVKHYLTAHMRSEKRSTSREPAVV